MTMLNHEVALNDENGDALDVRTIRAASDTPDNELARLACAAFELEPDAVTVFSSGELSVRCGAREVFVSLGLDDDGNA